MMLLGYEYESAVIDKSQNFQSPLFYSRKSSIKLHNVRLFELLHSLNFRDTFHFHWSCVSDYR